MRTRRIAPVAALAAASFALAGVAAAPALADTTSAFVRTATYPVYLNVPEGVDPAAETVAEISTVSSDGNTVIYTDALGQRIGFLDITDPANPVGAGTVSLSTLGHADDQPTSVAVWGDYVLVVIDETGGDFANPKGRVDILRVSDRQRVASIDLQGQPDSIDISADGKYAAIAIENQRDEDLGDGGLPQMPAGFVQVIDLVGEPTAWVATPVNFVDEAGAPLPIVAAAGWDTPEDAEPEYVTINGKNQLAVTLQENNGVAIIDLATRKITDAWSAGTVSVDGIDTIKDKLIDQSGSITDVPREPDAIAWVDDNHLATANEGDWKGGTRGWTVFSADGTVVWDAGASFEQIAVQHGLHNNDRAGKKGTEPEGLAIAEYNGVNYAFVASERSNFVAVYDMTDPANPAFTQLLFSTNGPEGILPVPSRDLLVVSSEVDDASKLVRSSVNIYEIGGEALSQPSIISQRNAETGQAIGWTALGALTAHPTDANTLYSANDSALADTSIYTIDVSAQPAVITKAVVVTKDGVAAKYDVEGIAARADGGFWLASEGVTGSENLLVRVDAAGEVQEEISLPAEVADHISKWGLEGVAATIDAAGNEVLYVAIQRPLWEDTAAEKLAPLEGKNTTRIGQYNTATGEWAWFTYELEATEVKGDWMGLSEIQVIDGNRLAVIERDKLNGPNAAVKRLYTVEIPTAEAIAAAGATPIALEKTLAFDVLPVLQSTNGWTQEKLEGFAIAADGSVYVVTDNDGLKDATGETVFAKLGMAADIFGTVATEEPTTEPTASAPTTVVPTTSAPAVDTDKDGNPITPSSSQPVSQNQGSLPTTGADANSMFGIAALAAALTGAGLLALRRRGDAS